MTDAEPYIAQLYDASIFVGTEATSPPGPRPSLSNSQIFQQTQTELFALRRQLAETKDELSVSQRSLRTAQETMAHASEVPPHAASDAVLPTLLTVPLPTSQLPETKLPVASLSKLSGEDSLKLTDWIADAQLISSLTGASEHQAAVWAVSHTTGQAKQVWRNANFSCPHLLLAA